jgi:iron(III) transport system substrate-binding protein
MKNTISGNISMETHGKRNRLSKVITMILALVMIISLVLSGCSKGDDNKVIIYTSSDENEIALMREMLDAKFPNYQISIEYIGTGNHAAKLKAEGNSTECDISYDLEYGYMEMLDKDGIFAELKDYDTSIFVDDLVTSKNYIPTMRYGGAIIINTKVLEDKGLKKPTSYHELLGTEYKELISMPSAKASGTGYMFYKSLVNSWGEEKALEYLKDDRKV